MVDEFWVVSTNHALKAAGGCRTPGRFALNEATNYPPGFGVRQPSAAFTLGSTKRVSCIVALKRRFATRGNFARGRRFKAPAALNTTRQTAARLYPRRSVAALAPLPGDRSLRALPFSRRACSSR